MINLRIWAFFLLPFLTSCLLTGCATTKAKSEVHTAKFFIESNSQLPAKWAKSIKLPISGMEHSIYPQPVLNEQDIASVELAKVDLGQCLSFQLTPTGTQKLYELSLQHPGESLFLMVNNEPMGFRGIDNPIANGHIMVFVEQPENALPALVKLIQSATTTPLAKK